MRRLPPATLGAALVVLAVAAVPAHGMGVPAASRGFAITHLRMTCLTMPGIFTYMVMMMMLRSSGDARTPFRFTLVWIVGAVLLLVEDAHWMDGATEQFLVDLFARMADRPVLAVVSRLVEQKGFDLLAAVLPWLLRDTDAQLVLLGSGHPQLEDTFRRFAWENPTRIAVRTAFDPSLAQRIYAGSDMFLMPSRFEPCGLGQMIALRYGSVPIVRATGGLNDTVREGFDGNGFRFHPFEAYHFGGAIWRALQAYQNREGWALLRERGMREDNSWSHAAHVYARMYVAAMRSRGR
mgnify:CR=1 FL=1